jgi:hypothetical protein
MITAIAERKAFSIEPITYPVIAEKISELAAEYMPLRVEGLSDKMGLKRVHDARIVVRDLRLSVERRRKELKAASLEYGKQVDSAAKSIFDLLEPIESHLQAEEDAVENEKKRIKEAELEAKRLKLQKRLDDILAYGVVFKPDWCEAMSDEAWEAELKSAKTQFELRQLEIAEAAELRKSEEAKLAAERAELDRIRKEQEAQAEKLRAEQKRIEDEAAAQRRAIELENAKREAAERARVETEQHLAREAEAKQKAEEARIAREKAEAEAKEAARLKAEAERPQREKLLKVADEVLAITVPEGPGADAVNAELERCEQAIRKIAEGPLR